MSNGPNEGTKAPEIIIDIIVGIKIIFNPYLSEVFLTSDFLFSVFSLLS